MMFAHARIQKVWPEGSNFDGVFVVVVVCLFFVCVFDERREDQNNTKSGPSSACQRNANEMAFLRRADDGPTLNVGCVAF